MKQRTLIFGALIAVIVIGLGGFFLYDWVLGETEKASGPIEATPVSVETNPPTATPTEFVPASITEQPVVISTEIEPTQEIPATESPTAEIRQAQPQVTVYTISQAESEVRFIIYEELRGQPLDVVGRSNQIAGQIAVDLQDLSSAEIGPIQVNARTLATDNENRNRAIRNRILNTDSFEFITFTPTEIVGLEGSAAIGEQFSFRVSGNLTIRDITLPVIFNVTAQATSEASIVGTATTTVQRSDFNLIVPSVPGVANVGEDVTLEIDFTAVAGG